MQEAAAAAFEQAWNVTRAAISDRDFMTQRLTPRRFAAVHAGFDPRLGTPDVLLANLLRAWPLPPDEPMVLSTSNDLFQQVPVTPLIDGPEFAALRRLTAEVAVLRSGLPRVLFEDQYRRQDLISTDVAATPADAAASVRPGSWSNAWLLLAGVPLLIYCLFAIATHRRKVRLLVDRWLVSERRSMRWPRALEGTKQTSGPLMEAAMPPLVDRRSLRGLIRYEPAPGRRLDAPRSIAALIRQEGVASPVMRPVRRAVSYVVIVQRRQPHDHERLRVRQLFAYLADRGLPFFAYDYDFDPLTVKRAAAAAGDQRSDGVNGREELVHLSALRDLHPKSRLVLVTDGRDLVDRFSGRVRADIARALAFWRDRMVLTPVPIGDWGEVELALSRDLGAPLGRTGAEAVADLDQGFRPTTGTPPYRLALLQARSMPNASGRLDAWWQAVAERFGSAAFLSRGDALSFDQQMLTTDIPPPNETIEAIVDDLYRWLGGRGFYWHAACAIYPQLRFDLTVHIGRALRSGPQPDSPVLLQDTADDRRAFERMTALPWFRSGRMPEWLRRRVLAALSREDLDRATAVIADLFRNAPAREGPLAVWWPRTGALAIPPDAVMSEAFLGDIKHEAEPIIVSEARKAELLQAARRVQLKRELATGASFLLACSGLWLLMPDLTLGPHVRGAWFPALGFAAACIAVLTTFVIVRRVWRSEPPLPPLRPVSPLPSLSPTIEQQSDVSEPPEETTGRTENAAPS
ncbi:hypothetical protein [Bradyrhizobium yuanmingense]|uniref:hypothetical protein n=1 Tax=Bradyrhizobium yuanmingense TaxID=108015 RepID=UPI0023B948E4|nr:hypothetical protein [Bradyrhizobium yuanmingense]MDF0495347.1 hypothetical protein [Bradyrhizobium yuanmingense]